MKALFEWLRFVGAGVVSYLLGAGLSWLLKEFFNLPSEAAVAISLCVMLVTNYALNRIFVFRAGGGTTGGAPPPPFFLGAPGKIGDKRSLTCHFPPGPRPGKAVGKVSPSAKRRDAAISEPQAAAAGAPRRPAARRRRLDRLLAL